MQKYEIRPAYPICGGRKVLSGSSVGKSRHKGRWQISRRAQMGDQNKGKQKIIRKLANDINGQEVLQATTGNCWPDSVLLEYLSGTDKVGLR